MITVSIGSGSMFFLLFPSFVIEKSGIFLLFVLTSEPLTCATCYFKLSFKDFFSTRNFKESVAFISSRFDTDVFPEK